MPPKYPTPQELDIAFDRFIVDARDDFFPDPLRYADLVLTRAQVLQAVRTDITRAFRSRRFAYANQLYYDWDVPKGHFVVRHAVCLHPLDRLVYCFLLHRLVPRIEPRLSAARYSYRVQDPKAKYLFGKRIVTQWLKFKQAIKASASKFNGPVHVVSTDIAGFYEYVHLTDFKKQIYNVSRTRPVDPTIELLNTFLRNYAPHDNSGIPQNYDPSSYLASAFLDAVDKDLEGAGYTHFRYVDDIKVVCKTKRQAQRAIVDLIHSLRAHNLNLSTNKTDIWRTDEEDYQDFARNFPAILHQTDTAVRLKVKKLVNNCLLWLVREIRTIMPRRTTKFNDRLFRAYTWRIVKCYGFKDLVSVSLQPIGNACLRLLESMPERTDSFCRFLFLLKDRKNVQKALSHIIRTTVYPWQEMLVWHLLTEAKKVKWTRLLALARRRIRDAAYPEAPRGYAALFLGKHGDYQDRATLAGLCRATGLSFFARRCMLLAIQEHPDREMTYNWVMGHAQDRAIKSVVTYVRQRQTPEYLEYDHVAIGEDSFVS